MKKGKINGFSTKKLSGMAMLAAMGVALSLIIHIPIIPAVSFLEYDPADIPIFLGTFMYGPVAGLILTLVVSVIQGVTVSAASGFIGIMMHFFATGSFVLTAGFIYKYHKTFKGAVIALVAGSLVMTGSMIIWNIIFTPVFMGVPRQVVYGLLLPAILPFNLIKTFLNSAVTIFLYKKVHKLFKYILKDKDLNL